MSVEIYTTIESCVRNNVTWQNLPDLLKQVLGKDPNEYEKYIINYSLRNQLRYRNNLVSKIFRKEEHYYSMVIETGTKNLSLFPYHLGDRVTKGLRVTPFNYYIDVISNLLKNDKSYDTLPNFTAADCLRVLGIGRNEYLALISEFKTHSSRLFRRPDPQQFLPKFPVYINIESWWIVEVGYILESDIKYVTLPEKQLIDDFIDFGPQLAGECDYNLVHSLYRKGLIYLDVPVKGEDKICIPPLQNFVMNRISGDYFENVLYKIFVSADEHMTMAELSNMLQIDLEMVQRAVSLFYRLGFAKRKEPIDLPNLHPSWKTRNNVQNCKPQITPLNYSLLINENSNELSNQKSPRKTKRDNSAECVSSDGNTSENSFTNLPATSDIEFSKYNVNSSEKDLKLETEDGTQARSTKAFNVEVKSGKRVAFLFDSTLTAFLMMGNLSPGLKNHAVTMFEVGKLCDESIDSFLEELEKVSLLDAEGEGEVSRYFAHAVILRSTIIALRDIVPAGLDLLRLECLESLDYKTRNRLLEKKYKFIISASPLSGLLSHTFTIPFFGQFYKSSENSHIWSKFFYYHISGYGPPSLLLIKGTILRSLPRIFLGYRKLLVTIIHTDSYVICSENFQNLNEQLKNGCVLVQGYGVRQPAEIRYESFPFDTSEPDKIQWAQHKAVLKLKEHIDFDRTCGYITFVNTGVPDIGCENYEIDVRLKRPKSKKKKSVPGTIISDINSASNCLPIPSTTDIPDVQFAVDNSEVTSFNRLKNKDDYLKTPDEDHFAVTPQNYSPSNVFRSDDCNELLAKELAQLDENPACDSSDEQLKQLVSQSSIEIPIDHSSVDDEDTICDSPRKEDYVGEPWTILDVNFGVPLFDVDCNTRICEYIVRNLCKDDNLQVLQEINMKINEKFCKFIKQCLYFEDEDVEIVKLGELLPPPRVNLAFENGKVCYWNGK